ncbi:MAG: amino acid adenylation domain-containing protein [bacterium]|nr:amino acid adenylation domain-containing protein [bacterium]
MSIVNLMSRLNRLRVKVGVEDERLVIDAPEQSLTPALVAELKERKLELIEFLGSFRRQEYTPIPPVEERDYYPLSHAQKRLWIINRVTGSDNTAYNMPAAFMVSGGPDTDALTEAFRQLIRRHESLRTFFTTVRGEPVQVVAKEVEFNVENITPAGEPGSEDREGSIKEMVRQHAEIHFDLSCVPLFNASVVTIDRERHLFLLNIHHIISDGWSIPVFLEELSILYNAYHTDDRKELLPPLRIQYKDYARWQNTFAVSSEAEEQKAYWNQKLSGEIPVLDLPIDFERTTAGTNQGDILHRTLDRSMTEGANRYCNEQGATLLMFLSAAVKTLLYRYTGQEDMIIGTVAAGRNHPDLEDQLGFYVNTLALRDGLDGEEPFTTFLHRVKQTAGDAFRHQTYPFDRLVDHLDLGRDTLRHPLFDVMVVVQNAGEGELKFNNLAITPLESRSNSSKFDLTFYFGEINHEIHLDLEYDSGLFREDRIRRMGNHFNELVESILSDPGQAVADLNIISPKEKHRVLVEFNGTQTAYPVEATIAGLFEEQAARTPDAIALVEIGPKGQTVRVQLTYNQLDEQAGKLSFQLRSKGVGNDTIVGLQTERTAAMIIGLLGILKAGGAYLPLTANYPQERIDYMLRDSGVEVLISSGIPRFDTPPPSGVPLSRGELAGVRLIDLKGIDGSNHSALGTGDDLNAEGFNSPLERGTPPAAGGGVSHRGRPPNSLAYIMYTSGSTGIPKGVMIEQKSVIRLVKKTGYIQITGQDRLLATCSLSFDVSTFEIWGSLLNGGTLYISGLDDIITPAVLSRILTDWGITIMWMTVGLFNQMADIDVEIFRPLSTLLVGGDRLSPVHIQKIRARYPAMQIINGYGPTENTSFTTTYSIGETITNDIPIGKPISNTRVYILDNRFHPVPVGVVGELCAAGDGLARGYLNNPELTGKKFDVRTSHFALYHTGDMARWLPDGNIEFLGRRDHQVKVRGFRIELGEIEYRLTQLPGISEAAVMVVENQREKELIAYIAAAPGLDSDTPVDVNIKEQLTEFLPDYMAPSHFIRLDKLPLNPSGKIDKKTLLMQFQPGTLQRRESYVPPRTQTEQKLVEIWQDILNRETIGVTDNFFEAGGHSLKATRLVSRVHKDLSVELRLQDIFKYRTVSQLARFINKKELSRFTRVQPVPVQDHYDLSHAQRRLWVLDRFEEGGSGYNIPYALTFTGPLDTGAFNRAFHCLIRRHESLRTGFTSIEGVPKQIIHPTLNFEVREVSLLKEPDRAKREKQAKTIAQQHAERVFDLTRVPLFDASLLEVAEDRHIFLFNMHHIVTDGWSMEVFARELAMFYNSLVTKGPRQTQNQDDLLPPLRIQYKDYAHWQHTHLNSPIASKAKAYWHAKLSGPPPALDFPIDYPRPRFKTSNGSVFQFELDDHLLPAIKELCTRQGITLFMLLTAAVNILLHRYTNQEDIVIGTPNAGRNHPDLEEQIGFYINTLALRGKVEADKTVVSFLKQVKQTVLDADQFQIYPFDSLVEELNLDRDTRRHPLFDIMIVMQNNDQPDLIFENITITPFEFEYNTSKFDMTFYFTETAEGIQVAVNYNTDILKKERIQRLRDHFSTLLTGILKEPGSAVSEISILSAEEEQSSETFKAELPLIEPSTVMDLFLENAGRLPDKPAIVYDTGQLTYSQLDRLTNRLAHCLQQLGIEAGQETPAAAMFGNDVRQVISLLAIFKARGIYVPIDTGSPADRLSQLFLQVEPKVLLTGRETSREILESAVSHPGFPLYIIAIDGSFDFRVYRCQDGTAVEESFDDFPGTCPLLELSLPLHAGSYIFFTSGSTGQPKAMLGSHTSLYHFIRWQSGEFGIDENCQCSQLSQSTFDASLRDIFVPLCSGGTLYIPGQATKDNLHKLLQWISLSRITLMNTVPSLLRSLMDIGAGTSLEHLQHLFVSGEPLFDGDIHRWRKCFGNTTELVNFYGTSETTMSKTFYRMPGDKIDIPPRIPTGPPLPNTMVAVIRDRRTCAVGEVGEIYIKTAYPTKGYYNNKPLTDSVFIPNPLTGDTGDIVHRTGDLGRYLPDMTVEVLGRVDHQVKINGIRVEPAEIEHRLTQHPEVEEAAVIARKIRDETDETVLAAFIVSNSHLDSNQIREYLSRFLPRYMVPSHVIKPDRLPRTASGKIDRNALSRLPLPDTSDHQRYVPPRNDTEKKLADIWQEVLNKETIGINDNFFAAGGHSLKAVQIVSRTHKTLSVELSLRDIFAFPTIAQLARQVEQTPGSRFSGIQPVEKKEYYELSNAQRRLWVIQQLDEKSISYNRPSALTIDGELNIPALTGAFRALIHRHESLRTSFITVNGAPKQIIHPAVAFTIREVSLMDINETDSLHREESVREIVRHHAAMVFDLSRAPLFDAMVLKTSRQRHVFLFNMHHIVTDGWSWGIITKQLEAFYNALNGDSGGLDQLLPPLNIQYKDYAGWQNSHLSSPLAKEAREYWHHQFSGELPLSDLPTDRPRPAVKTVNGNIINHTLGNHLTTTIDSLCSEREISLFMCLLSAVYLLIYRYTGQDDLIIGSPTAGRNHVDLEEQIGFYVNTLALRCRIDRGEPVATLFHQVKQTATHANDYQVYPFDKLVDELNLQRDTGRHPLFDVMVILHNTQQEDLELGNLEITPFETGSTTSRFDLALGFIQINGHIDMIVEYNTDLFETDRIQRLCTHFSHLLEGMTRDPEQSIKDVEILSIEEKHRLLVEFNDTQTETPTDKTIVSLFEEQVGKVPDSIAVKGTHGEISYLELHRRSSAVAYDLRENHGVRTGDRIAIMPERNEEMIIGLMGILMAGAAYVPIDPGYPQERIEYMLRDSGAGVLIGSGITRCDTPPPPQAGYPSQEGNSAL